MLICAYFLAFHAWQVIALEQSITSSSIKTSNVFHSKLNTNESHHSPSLSCFENPGTYDSVPILCSQNGPLLDASYCATFSEDTKTLSITKRPYFQPNA